MLKKVLFLTLIIFLILFCNLSYAQELVHVANVSAINGNLQFQRQNQVNWSEAYVKMPDYLYDKLKTDENSVADIEFTIGGHIGIDKSTSIELTGPRESKDITKRSFLKTVVLKTGTIWAKITKQQNEIEFQTQGGVLGVKGTEFVIEESEKNKSTIISVLEGEVIYLTPSKTIEASSGDKITIPWKEVPVIHHYKPEELRQECEQNHSILNNYIVQTIISYALYDVPYSYLAVGLITNPNQALKDAIASQVESNIPIAGGIFGSIISNVETEKKESKVDFPTGLAPDQCEVNSLNSEFTWNKFPDAASYWIFLSKNENMEPLMWNQKISQESVAYPNWAQVLSPQEKYFWRLIALASDDKPISKASQTYFTTSAYLLSEVPVNLILPVGEFYAMPLDLKFCWQEFQNAAGYKIIVSESESLESPLIDKIIAEKTEYKLSAEESKQIKFSKTYYWQVAAQDQSGNQIGKSSKIQEFSLIKPQTDVR